MNEWNGRAKLETETDKSLPAQAVGCPLALKRPKGARAWKRPKKWRVETKAQGFRVTEDEKWFPQSTLNNPTRRPQFDRQIGKQSLSMWFCDLNISNPQIIDVPRPEDNSGGQSSLLKEHFISPPHVRKPKERFLRILLLWSRPVHDQVNPIHCRLMSQTRGESELWRFVNANFDVSIHNMLCASPYLLPWVVT